MLHARYVMTIFAQTHHKKSYEKSQQIVTMFVEEDVDGEEEVGR